MTNVVGLVLFAVLLATGQFLFKRSANSIAGLDLVGSISTLFQQWTFFLALVLYGGSTILWVWILTRVPLSLAYPFVAVAMIIVPILGWHYFGESLSTAYWIGAALIIAGMLTMQLGS